MSAQCERVIREAKDVLSRASNLRRLVDSKARQMRGRIGVVLDRSQVLVAKQTYYSGTRHSLEATSSSLMLCDTVYTRTSPRT
ncbi:hypothetical protein DENSPDRAFT_836770 [Dentipellis sp. KUC8613]|nr:hypothetical protein DENSPDRAFT_836770 [Dentipellis sp. KUC8613]